MVCAILFSYALWLRLKSPSEPSERVKRPNFLFVYYMTDYRYVDKKRSNNHVNMT